MSSTKIRTVDIEALQFGLKLDIRLKDLNIVNLKNKNYNSVFVKEFIQGLITATTKVNTNDHILTKRHATVR